MNKNFKDFIELIPEVDEPVQWEKFEESFLSSLVEDYRNTHQRLDYHGEDDVWTHSKMVVDALIGLPEYKKLDRRLQEILFTAALFHDLGKIYTTKKENGEWTSPYHASVGADKFRELAVEELGLTDDQKEKDFAETAALLIANHVKPMHALKKRAPEKELAKLAALSEIAPEFTLELLSLLVEADMRGRISVDTEKNLKTIDRFRKYAKETGYYN